MSRSPAFSLKPYLYAILICAVTFLFALAWHGLRPKNPFATLELLALAAVGATALGGVGAGIFAILVVWIAGSGVLLNDSSLAERLWFGLTQSSLVVHGIAATILIGWAIQRTAARKVWGETPRGTGVDLAKAALKEIELLRAAKEASDAANQAKSEFLASMTHEIRTPLAAILGFSELLLDPGLSEADREKFVHIIRRNGELLSQIIGNVLDLSKIEAGRMEIERLRVNVRQLAEEVIESLAVRARSKDLALRLEVQDTALPPYVLTDPTRLKQILVNIVGNAIKFTERGSITVSVAARVTKPSTLAVEFLIKDTGIGFTLEQRQKLFQTFVQAECGTARKYGGTGLGLELSRRLARLLGGDVELVDSQPGLGSVFRVLIHVGVETPTQVTPRRRESTSSPERSEITSSWSALPGLGLNRRGNSQRR